MENGSTRRLRLIFADEGTFHAEIVTVRAASLAAYDRLVDLLQEDPDVTRDLYVDMRRLVSASVVAE
jgi:hypothetical protein